MRRRRLGIFALVLVALVGALATPTGTLAARPDLTISSSAAYDVQPDKGRVRVTVKLAMVNHLKDTKTKRYYFDEAFIDVMPHSSGFKFTRDETLETKQLER